MRLHKQIHNAFRIVEDNMAGNVECAGRLDFFRLATLVTQTRGGLLCKAKQGFPLCIPFAKHPDL